MIYVLGNSWKRKMRISERGHITIPKHLRERYELLTNVEVELVPTDEGLLIRKPVDDQRPVSRVVGILGKGALDEGVSVDDSIEEIGGR